MIQGSVNSHLDPIVRLTVQGPAGRQVDIDAVVDTGYDGWLTLPPVMIAQLGLAWQTLEPVILADGTTSYFDVYEGVVIWDGQPCQILVDESDTTPLLG